MLPRGEAQAVPFLYLPLPVLAVRMPAHASPMFIGWPLGPAALRQQNGSSNRAAAMADANASTRCAAAAEHRPGAVAKRQPKQPLIPRLKSWKVSNWHRGIRSKAQATL